MSFRVFLLEANVFIEKRNYIAREILTTERNYLHDICTIKEVFEPAFLSNQVIAPQLVFRVIPPVLAIIIDISGSVFF